MSELDKFKRRTIRSVARLLLKEKKPPEELWQEMKKETGTDCRTLWERMRALCVKKLNRMIAVDDRSASLPSIARLSLTDWLLVDLVLVHEEIDVIAMDKPDNNEHPALVELFNLVQRFDVEGRAGEPLAEAWAAATVFYNRQGRQCSPMLLQRRWYQLKKLTRCRFYKFWFSYRGNTRLLEEARKSMPTRLQMAIAKRYPQVITKEYPDWEELIEKRFVIMPEEFEAKMRMPNLPKPCNSNAPDLVLVEPVIETIDLRIESDHEDHNDDEMEDGSEHSNDASDVTYPAAEEDIPVTEEDFPVKDEFSGIQVKTEPIEDGLSNVQLISATHVPEVEIPDEGPDENLDVAPKIHTEETQNDISPNEDEDDIIEIPSDTPDVHVEQLPTNNIVQTKTAEIPSDIPCVVDKLNDSDDAVDDIIKVKADEYCRKKNELAEDNNTIDDLIKGKVETYLKTPKDAISLTDKKPDSTTDDSKNKAEVAAIDLMADLNFVDEGIEFVDDGVEFVEEDQIQNNESTPNIPSGEDNLSPVDEEVSKEENKFDMKLLMYPVVYTTKIDHMKIFKNKQIDSVKGIGDIEMSIVESKPISNKAFDLKIKEESVTTVVEDVAASDDLFTNQEASEDENIEDDYLVSPNSYLLKKPRTRTYDPINVCKNPDFNTKLKRLTIGFLSSTRNRQLLNACIPMTIDLSKAFESKLLNGTLYLKSSGTAQTEVKQESIEKQASTILPTAMAVQCLIDNSKVDIQNLISHSSSTVEPMVSERTKVINLPDIDKVRRINQQLLTAQVPPLRVFAGNNNANKPHEVNPTVEPVEPETEFPSTQNTIKIKVEGEKSVDTSLPQETLPPAKEKLVKMINEAKLLTKEALDKIDDVTKANDFPMPIVIKEVVTNIPLEVPTRKHHFQPRVPLAWAPKQQPIRNNFDDFGLLTSDTLNKMLHLLMSGAKAENGCKCCGIKKNKKKKKRKRSVDRDKKDSDNSDVVQEVVDKVKVVDKGKTSDEIKLVKPPQTKNLQVVPVSKVLKTKFCCWANQKLCNRKRMSRHLCPPNPCTCCCADQLVKKIKADEEKRRLQIEAQLAAKTIVELSDDEEESLKKACESIETVVQQSVELTDHSNIDQGQENTPVIPVVSVVDVTHVPTVTVASPTKPVIPSISVEVVAPSVSKVTIELGGPTTKIKETPTSPPNPYMKIRATPIASLMPDREVINRTPINRTPQITVPTPRIQIRSKKKPVDSGQLVACSCQGPALSQDSRRNIVIDASKICAIHPTPIAAKPTSLQHTVLDASVNYTIHPTHIAPKQMSPQKSTVQNQHTPNQSKEKVIYLHSKSLAKSPSESPIFLGKNKILLTTVKLPRKNDEVVAPPTEVFQAPKVIPTLQLPPGVQLVLMPSGNVTYTVDPGVELDEEQMAGLPTILAAVQEQLNASGVTATAGAEPQVNTTGETQPVSAVTQPEISAPENVNLPEPDQTAEMPQAESNVINAITESPPTIQTLETNEIFQDTELPPKNTTDIDMEAVVESAKEDTPVKQNTSNITSELDKDASGLERITTPNSEKVTSPITNDADNPEVLKDVTESLLSHGSAPAVEEKQNEIQTQESQSSPHVKETSDDKDGISNRKSLLSDLMMMSGISAEDMTAPEPPPPEPLGTEQVQHAANIVVNAEAKNPPELSPVTSFAELKYACEHNGKFFKLDFETGIIVPINVCIKKNPKNKTTPTKTKEFVDLTDDVESIDVDSHEKQDTMNKSSEDVPPDTSVSKEPEEYLFNGKTVNVSSTIKPVKLFKAFRPAPPRVLRKAGPSGLLKSPGFESSVLIKQSHVEKRKQSLRIVKAKVEAKIDLVDSDEPMEEEYLVDSSDDEISDVDKIYASRRVLEAIQSLDNSDSEDSSDDEPLAKKSKRLKEVDKEDVRETNIFDEIPDAVNPDESSDMEDLPIDTGTDISGLNDVPVRQDSVTSELVPATNVSRKDATSRETDEPPAKVKQNIVGNVTDSEIPVENEMDDPDEFEDEEMDQEPPELRFLSDHSEGGEDDCILGV